MNILYADFTLFSSNGICSAKIVKNVSKKKIKGHLIKIWGN